MYTQFSSSFTDLMLIFFQVMLEIDPVLCVNTIQVENVELKATSTCDSVLAPETKVKKRRF